MSQMAAQIGITKFTIINIRKDERPFGTINIQTESAKNRDLPLMIKALATTFLRSFLTSSTASP
jgi:DNA-binding XRE family transcriptional regulator